MKRCPICERTYADDETTFCLADGALLSPPFDSQQTLVMNETPAGEAPTETLPDAESLSASQPVEATQTGESSTAPSSKTEQEATVVTTSGTEASATTAAATSATSTASSASSTSAAKKTPKATQGSAMSTTTKGLIAAAVALALAAGLIVWQVKASRARSVNLSTQDMELLAKDQDPRLQMQLSASEEARKEFAKNLREVLALGEEARAAGVADQPEIKRQLALMRSLIIANAFLKKKQQESPGVSPLSSIPQAEVDAFLKEPGVEEKFKQFLEDAQALGLIPAGQQIPEAQLAQVKT
jgi:hypothetical protein